MNVTQCQAFGSENKSSTRASVLCSPNVKDTEFDEFIVLLRSEKIKNGTRLLS